MSFSYIPEELPTSPLFQVRLKTGQTREDLLIQMSDEEIAYLLSTNYGDVTKTSIEVINNLIAQAASFVDKTTGQVSEAQSQFMKNLKDLRDDLYSNIARQVPAGMQFTGIFVDDINEINSAEELYHDGFQISPESPSKVI